MNTINHLKRTRNISRNRRLLPGSSSPSFFSSNTHQDIDILLFDYFHRAVQSNQMSLTSRLTGHCGHRADCITCALVRVDFLLLSAPKLMHLNGPTYYDTVLVKFTGGSGPTYSDSYNIIILYPTHSAGRSDVALELLRSPDLGREFTRI